MRFAQLVMGPAGSGKSTYCDTIHKHCENMGRNVQVVNLDPAAEHFSYPVAVDIRELVELDDVMEAEDLKLGPNGGLIFCLEYFVKNFEWLQEQLGEGEEDYILFDCPGQIELYTHLPVMKQLVETLQQWDFRVCGVFLIDSQFMVECSKFFSGILSALSAMIQLEVPHVNVMTKMDLLSSKQMQDIESIAGPGHSVLFAVHRFLDPDPRMLVHELGDGMNKKFWKLNEAIAQVIEDYSMVCFLPLNSNDEDSITQLLGQIDMAIQYGEDTDVKTKDYNEFDEEDDSLYDQNES